MSKTIRALVIDDEPLACRRVSRMLRATPGTELIDVCTNGVQAVAAIRKHHPDLIFLDVQMPEMDGFEVLRSLETEEVPHVIFVTAYDQYAIRAFEVHALDYLLKPFSRNRFERAVEHARNQIRQENTGTIPPGLVALITELKQKPKYVERLMIRNEGRVVFIRARDIDWIEAEGKYARIHILKQAHLVRQTMSTFEADLDPSKFIRIHKSAIVNIERIDHLEQWFHGDYRMILRDGTQLTVSRRFWPKVQNLLGKFV